MASAFFFCHSSCLSGTKLSFIRNNSLKWHKKMQGSVLVEIEGANHIANQDNPDQFNEALLNFLESIDKQTQN